MLEVFDELGLKPKIIAGTSIGAMFGAAYASGISARQIRAHAEEVLRQRLDLMRQLFSARSQPIQRMLGVLPLRSALFNAEALLGLVMPLRMAKEFSALEIPLRVVASDFFAQEQVVISEGPLLKAVGASIALPVLFAPVMADGRALMDGGLVNPLPFDLVAGEADITVAIDVSGAGRVPGDRAPPSAFEAIVASSQILQHSIVREKLRWRQPDIYIDVDVDRFHVLEFHKLDKVLAAARPAKEALRRQLARIMGSETLLEVERVEALPAPDPKPRRRLLKRLKRPDRTPRE
jgi:NTE family protein